MLGMPPMLLKNNLAWHRIIMHAQSTVYAVHPSICAIDIGVLWIISSASK